MTDVVGLSQKKSRMDDVWTLLLLSFSMLIGCYVAGCIPLAITLSEEKMKLVTVLGAGLLVGTALAVIIPEGVHTLYMSQGEHHHEHEHAHEVVAKAAEKPAADAAALSQTNQHSEHEHMHLELHSFIGVALVLGFVFMLLVDQLSGGTTHVHAPADPEVPTGPSLAHNRNRITATLGLVVHAAADGVALGAAATTSQTHVEMIVFIAIMLHKAPAAFGLVSFLMHEGHDRTRIRKHLAVFSAAAPIMAIFTFFGLSQHSKEALSNVNATGIAMLFSAGTFLYVATVHVLPELTSMGQSQSTPQDGTVVVREHKGFTKIELLTMVVGALLPLILSLGHHH